MSFCVYLSSLLLGNDLRLVSCTSKSILPFCLQLMLACFKVQELKPHHSLYIHTHLNSLSLSLCVKLRAFTDNRDDLALGHVIVLLQYDWPQGENLFLKAVDKICQQGSFQYENFFNYVTSIQKPTCFWFYRELCVTSCQLSSCEYT